MRIKVLKDRYWYAVDIDSRPDNWFYYLHKWCDDHCAGDWTTTSAFIGFEKVEDATFFILAYSHEAQHKALS